MPTGTQQDYFDAKTSDHLVSAHVRGFMLNILLGVAAVIVTAFAFWSVLPVDGKMNARIKPAWEPYIAIAIVFLFGMGIGLIVTGTYDILT